MLFTVDTEKCSIRALKTKFVVDIPKDQLDWWVALEEKARNSVYNSSRAVTHIHYNSGHVEFGYIVNYTEILKDGTEKERRKFICCFYLDLSDYILKSSSGYPMKADIINDNLRYLSIYDENGESEWLSRFYELWTEMAYPKRTTKTKGVYMFKLSQYQLNRLKAAEKLTRAGWTWRLKEILDEWGKYLDPTQEPWQFLMLPKQVFSYLVANEKILQTSYYYYSGDFLKRLRSFKHWNEIWSPLTQTDLLFSLFKVIISRDKSTFLVNLDALISDKNYDRVRLLEYLFKDLPEKQGFLDTVEATEMLRDYAAMSFMVYDKVEDKYPKALKTAHDIMINKSSEVQSALEDIKAMDWYDRCDARNRYAYCCQDPRAMAVWDEYGVGIKEPLRIEVPNRTKDIVDEGKAMHHCVASYVPRIGKGETLILFMRSYDTSSWDRKMRRHLTIEIIEGNIINQARGLRNHGPSKAEFIALAEWAQAKNLRFESSLLKEYEIVVGEKFPISKKEKVNAK